MNTPRILIVGALAITLLGAVKMAVAQQTLATITIDPAAPPPAAPAAPPRSAHAASSALTSSASPSPAAAHPKGLRYAADPPKGVELVTSAAEKILQAEPGDSLEIKGLPVYELTDNTALAPDGGFITYDDRQFTYYVKCSGEPLGLVQVFFEPQSSSWKIKGAASSNYTGITSMVDDLAGNERVMAGSYEAREIFVSGLGRVGGGRGAGNSVTQMIWLKSDPGGTDLIYVPPNMLEVPIQGAPRTFGVVPGGIAPAKKEGHLYTPAEFIQAISDYHDAQRAAAAPARAQPVATRVQPAPNSAATPL